MREHDFIMNSPSTVFGILIDDYVDEEKEEEEERGGWRKKQDVKVEAKRRKGKRMI